MKDKKKLLNEEIKRFNMLNEYSFYVPEGDDPVGDVDDLLLSEEDPEDDLEGLEGELDAEGGDVADPEMEGEPADDMGGEEPAMDEPMDDMGGEELSVEPEEEEVELDVTELVASADEAKASADSANQKVDQLLGMVGKLEAQLDGVNAIGAKIDNLENELEKRAPTPEEKIEMRSLDSYPYNLKLTDFWKTQEGKYDVLGTDEEEGTPEEYTLTADDVDSDYSESSVRTSLDDMGEYEEEDI
jgi:hypothetical protein